MEKGNLTKYSFTVREMEIGDLADVYHLGEQSFKANLWPMLYRSWDEYEVTTLFNTDGNYCLVAENDDEKSKDRIVGFILGTVVCKPGSAWSYGYIIWLCSHSKWGRAGVAGKLVDKLVERMIEEDSIRIVMADTDPDNVPAVKFFQKKGFDDQKEHLYLTSNLELNPYYSDLVKKSRVAAADAQQARRVRRLSIGKMLVEANKNSEPRKAKKPKTTRTKS